MKRFANPCLCGVLAAVVACTPEVPAQTTASSQTTTSATVVSSQPTQAVSAHMLLDGTPIKMRISQTISSSDAQVGQEVPFEVLEEVDVDGVPVIAKGARAMGTVTAAEPKRHMARGGKLDISISYVRLQDQEKAALRAIKDGKGGDHAGAMTGAMVATAIVFWPAAPFFLLMHGKDITIPQGTEITAYIAEDMHLDMARFGAVPATQTIAATSAPAQASLIIESTPAGADIEIDGFFVGNTPSTVSLAPGSHQVSVEKKGFSDWTRKMNVTSGSVHLNAELESKSGN